MENARLHENLQQKELLVHERYIAIHQLGTQLREKDEIIQRKIADISTLQREVQRLQVNTIRGDKDTNFVRNET